MVSAGCYDWDPHCRVYHIAEAIGIAGIPCLDDIGTQFGSDSNGVSK